jgi:hypothetical protein
LKLVEPRLATRIFMIVPKWDLAALAPCHSEVRRGVRVEFSRIQLSRGPLGGPRGDR